MVMRIVVQEFIYAAQHSPFLQPATTGFARCLPRLKIG
jgi:hypothetical protein